MVGRSQLQALVDSGDLDGLFALVSPEDVAGAWWGSTLRDEALGRDSDEDWWAVDLWLAGGQIYRREDDLRRGLLALAERAPDGADLGYLGAEPFENAVIEDQDRLRWIEDQAHHRQSFRAALANVWIHNLSPETFLRVERAAGVQLPWPSSGPLT